MRPLRVRERTLADGSLAYSVDGSPTDAVSLAFLGYFDQGFDLVASGINYGANLGDDITYSGTVSAAMESVINGCPAFAISQEYYEHPDFTLSAMAAAVVARNILEHGLAPGELINVNVPAVDPSEFEGFEVTRLGKRVYQDELIQRVDPRGIPYYWIGGPPPSGLARRRDRFPRRRQPPDRGHADPPRPDRAAAAEAAAHVGVAGARQRIAAAEPATTLPPEHDRSPRRIASICSTRSTGWNDADDPGNRRNRTSSNVHARRRPRSAVRAGCIGDPPAMNAATAALAEARLDRFLTSEPVVWLSTVRPDGAPHLVPIWFTWDGNVAARVLEAGRAEGAQPARQPGRDARAGRARGRLRRGARRGTGRAFRRAGDRTSRRTSRQVRRPNGGARVVARGVPRHLLAGASDHADPLAAVARPDDAAERARRGHDRGAGPEVVRRMYGEPLGMGTRPTAGRDVVAREEPPRPWWSRLLDAVLPAPAPRPPAPGSAQV